MSAGSLNQLFPINTSFQGGARGNQGVEDAELNGNPNDFGHLLSSRIPPSDAKRTYQSADDGSSRPNQLQNQQGLPPGGKSLPSKLPQVGQMFTQGWTQSLGSRLPTGLDEGHLLKIQDGLAARTGTVALSNIANGPNLKNSLPKQPQWLTQAESKIKNWQHGQAPWNKEFAGRPIPPGLQQTDLQKQDLVKILKQFKPMFGVPLSSSMQSFNPLSALQSRINQSSAVSRQVDSAVVEGIALKASAKEQTESNPIMAQIPKNPQGNERPAELPLQAAVSKESVLSDLDHRPQNVESTTPRLLVSNPGVAEVTARPLSVQGTEVQHNFILRQPLHKHEWNSELGNRLVWLTQQDVNTARLQLNPAHLGPIDIRINLNNESANVLFATNNMVVRDALEAALPRLREMMAENGVQLNQADISDRSLHSHDRDAREQKRLANLMHDAHEDQMEGLTGELTSPIALQVDSVIDYFV